MLKKMRMSFFSRFCNVVLLSQQYEQSNYYHNQCNDFCIDDYKKSSKNCTVVENGRVVVKQLEAPTKSNEEETLNKQQED